MTPYDITDHRPGIFDMPPHGHRQTKTTMAPRTNGYHNEEEEIGNAHGQQTCTATDAVKAVQEEDLYDTWETAPFVEFQGEQPVDVLFWGDRYETHTQIYDNKPKVFWKWQVTHNRKKHWLSTASRRLKQAIICARRCVSLEGRTFRITKQGTGTLTRWFVDEATPKK